MNSSGKHRLLFGLALVGILIGLFAAYLSSRRKTAEPPVFSPAHNPFIKGIYANGIVESHQSNGANINLYPEVSGVVTGIRVTEGQPVSKGDILLTLDDSVQRATTEQLKAQAEAARAVLEELKAQPRKEVLEVSAAQVEASAASLKNVRDQLAKLRRSYRINPRSISKYDLDNASNAVRIAESNLKVARRQYDLTRAGAWIYDIQNQERQVEALKKSAQAAEALLGKYAIKAPVDGSVLAITIAKGSYVSPQGAYGTYTQGFNPILVMGETSEYLAVRCFVDEILVNRLPDPSRMTAQMSVRGTNTKIELEYERTQPYVTPKIELSDQRQERVDVRVLPIIFRFKKPPDTKIFPGQLVDVYVGESESGSKQLGGQAKRSGGN